MSLVQLWFSFRVCLSSEPGFDPKFFFWFRIKFSVAMWFLVRNLFSVRIWFLLRYCLCSESDFQCECFFGPNLVFGPNVVLCPKLSLVRNCLWSEIVFGSNLVFGPDLSLVPFEKFRSCLVSGPKPVFRSNRVFAPKLSLLPNWLSLRNCLVSESRFRSESGFMSKFVFGPNLSLVGVCR